MEDRSTTHKRQQAVTVWAGSPPPRDLHWSARSRAIPSLSFSVLQAKPQLEQSLQRHLMFQNDVYICEIFFCWERRGLNNWTECFHLHLRWPLSVCTCIGPCHTHTLLQHLGLWKKLGWRLDRWKVSKSQPFHFCHRIWHWKICVILRIFFKTRV